MSMMKEATGPVEVKAERRKAPKVLSEVTIKRGLDGGHVVTHRYEGYEHDPRSYKFGPTEGSRAASHVSRHTGLPMAGVAADGEEGYEE